MFVDDTEVSLKAWKWAQEHTIREGDHVTLVTVAKPEIPSLASAAVLGAAPVVNAELEAIEASKKAAKAQAHEVSFGNFSGTY